MYHRQWWGFGSYVLFALLTTYLAAAAPSVELRIGALIVGFAVAGVLLLQWALRYSRELTAPIDKSIETSVGRIQVVVQLRGNKLQHSSDLSEVLQRRAVLERMLGVRSADGNNAPTDVAEFVMANKLKTLEIAHLKAQLAQSLYEAGEYSEEISEPQPVSTHQSYPRSADGEFHKCEMCHQPHRICSKLDNVFVCTSADGAISACEREALTILKEEAVTKTATKTTRKAVTSAVTA